jgi:hypothetical protein
MTSLFVGVDKENLYRLFPEDPFIIVGSSIAFFIIRWILNKLIYKPIADYLKLEKSKEKKNKSSKYQRFVEDIWYSTFYPLSVVIMFFIIKGLKK